MLRFKIFLSTLVFNIIFSSVLKNCEIGSYCHTEQFGCSVYGNCNYNLFEYYKVGSTEKEKAPDCECFHGYSSYDIDVQHMENNVKCCYKKKGALKAFFLELFLGFGLGHFYLGNYIFACVKLCIEIFFCVTVGCVLYFACSREHSFETSNNDNNNNENIKNLNENKNNENKNNEMIDENENNDSDSNENKNEDYKNKSFELEENKENEIMFRNFISCPKSMFVIYFSLITFILFHIVDVCLIAFGIFKDENGEELYMWS